METADYTPAPWEQPGWEQHISTWTAMQLAAHGLQLTGALEAARVRPWSALWKAPTTIGLLWLKACAPTMKHEVVLIDFMLRLQPEKAPPIYGLEREQGLILMENGGELLRLHMREKGDLTHWARILPSYATLQMQAASHSAELLTAGVVDRRLEKLPAIYEDLLADEALLAVGAPHGLTPVEHAKLIALIPTFARQCAELASLGIPATIDHSDLHDGNILIQNGHYRLIDWGDTCVTHPFLTMLVTLRSIAYGLGLVEDDPALHDLRDRYLAQWSAYGALDDLRRALQLAQPLTMVNRALTWRRALATLPPDQHGEYADAVPGWLQEMVQTDHNKM